MLNLPAELAALIAGLSPEQQDTFFAILQNARDEADFIRELQRHPDLLRAHLAAITSGGSTVRYAHSANLGAILHIEDANRFLQDPRGSRAENLEHAIMRYQQALDVLAEEAFPEYWAMSHTNLGLAYLNRIQGKREENLELSIEHFKNALMVCTREVDSVNWAVIQTNLAGAYGERIWGERAENRELSIEHCRQALMVFSQEGYPEEWAKTLNTLAAAYGERIRGARAENMERAIDYFTQALMVFSQEGYPEEWAMTQSNLSLSYGNRILGERAENLEQSIACCKQALEVYKREAHPEDWARTQNNLADTYCERIRGQRAENLEQAIAHYREALTVYTRDAYPEGWARTQSNLATTYVDRIRGERAGNLAKAISHYQQALTVITLARSPADCQRTQRNLGDLYFVEGDWAGVMEAYHEAISAERMLLAGAYTETGRQAEVAQTAPLYGRAAYAQLKLGRAGEALVQLEQGKARLLLRALALSHLDLSPLPAEQRETIQHGRQTILELENEMRLPPDTPARRDERMLAEALRKARSNLNAAIETIRATHPDFISKGLGLAEILALIPEDGVLVVPVVTSKGSAVFVVPAGVPAVTMDHVLWLDDFEEADLQMSLLGSAEREAELGGWLGAYFHAHTVAKPWFDIIEVTGQVLWDLLLAPIADRLATLQIKHVLLMPTGGLGLLPLHATWRAVDGKRRYLLDDYTVTYAPSAYVQKVSTERVRDAQRQVRTLFAVVNPTQDLPFTLLEGEQVARWFGEQDHHVLSEDEARPDAVTQALAAYLHFACHGFYQWDDPMQSGLILAQGEPLTLAQIIGHLILESTRLVTLSACETGLTDIRLSPEEYLGLPAGFLQAGAPAVVSTLWAVNDLSTMLLMERFYKLHLQDEIDIPVALRQAQIWLRDVTSGELARRFADEEDAMLGTTRLPIETTSKYFARFSAQDPEQRPFAHPYYWAAFTFSGA